mmetsp:Transcript_32592/g.76105  ORF Transcript_32592/g.76105 Transcript_32592/m.76105 type:complete len:235 (+) Transcript_32592:543-1247(+)
MAVLFVQTLHVCADVGPFDVKLRCHLGKYRHCAYAVLIVDKVSAAKSDALLKSKKHLVPLLLKVKLLVAYPLESCKSFLETNPLLLGQCASHLAADSACNNREFLPLPLLHTLLPQPVSKKHPNLISAEHPPTSVGLQLRHRKPVSIGVVGEYKRSASILSSLKGELQCPLTLLGVGVRDSGKGRVRGVLRLYPNEGRVPKSGEGAFCKRRPYTVHRRVDNLQGGGGVGRLVEA